MLLSASRVIARICAAHSGGGSASSAVEMQLEVDQRVGLELGRKRSKTGREVRVGRASRAAGP